MPPDLTNLAKGYRFRALLAIFGLLVFLLIYLALASWFSYTSYRLLRGVFAKGEGAVASFFSALPALFLSLFMWKALFTFSRDKQEIGIEIQEPDEPELFRFIYEIADEIGAPRPYRVFLTPDVNAFVFYDLSIWNLLFPSRKNLAIGIGLVNALNRTEFKAVLAHEFGHFAQRSMAVGRWVYNGQLIAGNIIAKRDFLDRGLRFLSTFDLRLAWIGWILEFVIWSIRSLTEAVFGWVVLAHRALSREMEFQADRVAVSVAGSDAIVHALYKLIPADSNWNHSLEFANRCLDEGKIPNNLYEVQTRIGEHLNRILPETSGIVPPIPVSNPANHRIFTKQLAQPPQMWSTHPPNTAREENAKQVYTASEIEEESAWKLFLDNKDTSEKLTKFVLRIAYENNELKPSSSAENLKAVDEDYEQEFLEPRYQGVYLYGRKLTLAAESFEDWMDGLPERNEIENQLNSLYSESIGHSFIRWDKLNTEIGLLEALSRGEHEATGGQLKYQGETISKNAIGDLMQKLKKDRTEILSEIENHDRIVRQTHYAAARFFAHGLWQDYLGSLGQALHYAEHRLTDLQDSLSNLSNMLSVTLVGRASEKRIHEIIKIANETRTIMGEVFKERLQLKLPPAMTKNNTINSFQNEFKFDLPKANRDNIESWISVVESWSRTFVGYLSVLREQLLSELLRSEDLVGEAYLSGVQPPQAPASFDVPKNYPLRPHGTERKRQQLSWWEKFKVSDDWFPKLSRLAVASCVVASVVALGNFVGASTVIIYNGLANTVSVKINELEPIAIGPLQYKELPIGTNWKCQIETQLDGRLVESFEANTESSYSNYVYNVASAAPFVLVTANYGTAKPVDPVYLGFPRWHNSKAQFHFRDPPAQLKTDSSGATRTALASMAMLPPRNALQAVTDEEDLKAIVHAHVMWDDSKSQYFEAWLRAAMSFEYFEEVIQDRLKHEVNNLTLLRGLQQFAKINDKHEILLQHREFAKSAPNDPGLQYLAVRAMPNGKQQDEAFLQLYRKWPENTWINYATAFVFTTQDQWEKALQCSDVAGHEPALQENSLVFSARILRFLDRADQLRENKYQSSFLLQNLLELENGTAAIGAQSYAFTLINEGKLDEAANCINDENQLATILLGCSEGATEQQQQAALDFELSDIGNLDIVIFMKALAFRTNRSTEPFIKRIEELDYTEDKIIHSLLRDLSTGRFDEKIQDKLSTLSLRDRAIVTCAGVLMHPNEAPSEWRKMASRLLFASERPYLLSRPVNQ